MNLWAISDLHVGYEENRRAVQAMPDVFPAEIENVEEIE